MWLRLVASQAQPPRELRAAYGVDEYQNVYGTHIRIWSGVADSGDCWSAGVAAAIVGCQLASAAVQAAALQHM